MQFLSIGVSECADEVVQLLKDELQNMQDYGIDYTITEAASEGMTSVICSADDNAYTGKHAKPFDILKIHVSNALADFIIGQYEKKLIERVINSNYCYFIANEKKEILGIALKIIKNDDKNILNSLLQIRRRNIIVRKLTDYFDNSSTLILDGFINFRLKDYRKDLEEVVDRAVDDFLMEREYREFIRLLRYFVDIQEPKFDVVHVIVGFDGKYMLLDDARREITNECIREFINEIAEGEINYDDLLVSSLITLAPNRIVIHNRGQFRNKELLETIKNVFCGKVTICGGCEICLVSMIKSE